ncbi:protein kinase domain-containing protein [Trichoderma breve]|uniref:Protein kinase domain-containing protein n=1 Tax=Trichoderma breve TaxID=2034170 RepID=A0A9W9E9M1_9HYPO|nr:protein kinase domain-containing protein [Trichoderma breve]KAJ4860061.1 protein kinase domain-containing protein [Trichoderma breve]
MSNSEMGRNGSSKSRDIHDAARLTPRPQQSGGVSQQESGSKANPNILEDADNLHKKSHSPQNVQKQSDPGFSSSAGGSYDDLKLGTVSSSFWGTIINRVRKQPKSYNKKAKYQFGKTHSDRTDGTICEAEGPSGLVAIKTIAKKVSSSAEKEASREINALRRLNHLNIIQLVDWFESRDNYYIVTQNTNGGSLFDRVIDLIKFREREATVIVLQVLSAVAYLHSNSIIHRDIKTENIVYASKAFDSRVILTGFGVSAIQSSADEVFYDFVGSFGYAAPEVVRKAGHGRSADIWSIGVVTYVLLCGYTPFRSTNIQDFLEESTQEDLVFHEKFWKDIGQDAKDFISSLMNLVPEKRPTCQNALAHSWIDNRPSEASRINTVEE